MKKIIAFLLVLTLVIALVGCTPKTEENGNNNDNGGGNNIGNTIIPGGNNNGGSIGSDGVIEGPIVDIN